MKTATDDFKHRSSKFYACFIVFKDAFRSLDHRFLINLLLESGIEHTYCRIIADIYEDLHIEVICGDGLLKELLRTVVCKTGDPGSPIYFIIGLNRILWGVLDSALLELNISNERQLTPIPLAAFADDVALTSLLERVMKVMVEKLKSNIVESGLSVRSDKCAVFYERRSGNRWYKAKSDSLPEIEFNNEKMPVLKRKETFVYLGKPLTVAGETEEELIEMLNDYRDLLSLKFDIGIGFADCNKNRGSGSHCVIKNFTQISQHAYDRN